VHRLLQAEDGQAVIEYAMLAVLIVIVAITFMSGVGAKTAGLFQKGGNGFP